MHLYLILPVIWLAVISPGADFAMVSRISSIEGRQAGMAAALGIALGCWFHVAYAVFGFDLIERLFPPFLIALKIAGAAYLVWLGWRMTKAHAAEMAAETAMPGRAGLASFVPGLLTNALNPKTAIFVVSLYAQAIGPNTTLATRIGYGAVISLSHLLWFMGVAIFLSRPSIRRWVLMRQNLVNRSIGAALILLGIGLAAADLRG